MEETRHVVVVVTPKSMGLGLLLTFLFGPIGMFYSTIAGAIIMLILSAIVGVITVGFGLLIMWPIQLIWTAAAINTYNKGLAIKYGQK